MDNGMSLSDIAMATNGGGWGGNCAWVLILFVLIFGWGGNGYGNRGGDFGNYATAASQNEILLGQHFSDLDNKIDRIGNGIADLGYANQGLINNAQTVLGGAITAEGRAVSDKLYEISKEVHAEGEATRAMIQQNKIESLQAQVNELKTQNMFCGIPRINPYGYQVVPNATGCCCGSI